MVFSSAWRSQSRSASVRERSLAAASCGGCAASITILVKVSVFCGPVEANDQKRTRPFRPLVDRPTGPVDSSMYAIDGIHKPGPTCSRYVLKWKEWPGCLDV